MAVQLLVTDQNLNVIGDPLSSWTNLTVTRNDNSAHSGQLDLVAYPETMALLAQTGTRLVVMRDGAIWTAGPIEVPEEWEVGIGGDSGGQDVPEPGENTLSFSNDDALIAGKLSYPNPALAASSASQPANYTSTAGAETIMRDLVNRNAGPGALANRRIPGLVLGAVSGAGTSTSLTTRFEKLGDVLRTVALAGGDLAFGTEQVDNQIVWSARARRDLTSMARFSLALNNLRYVKFKRSAPTATTAIVASSGEGTARTIIEVTDSAAEAAWGRSEVFVDSSSVANDATGEMTTAGQQALASAGSAIELSTVTVDLPDGPDGPGLIAGRDFQVSDLVTIELPTGLEVAQYVRSDTLTATPDGGELVTCVIGTQDAAVDHATDLILRDFAQRLGRIEAR